jgi:RimJ/RimL family protein N-acetyltransferase
LNGEQVGSDCAITSAGSLTHPTGFMENNGADVAVREATPAEGPALVRLAEAINDEAQELGSPQELKRMTDIATEYLRRLRESDTGSYLVASSDGEIVGFVGVRSGPLERTRGTFSIPHIGVSKALRRRGVGELLLQRAELWARNKQAHRIELRVPEANTATLALCRKCGYAIEGRLADALWHDDGWQADISLGRVLKEAGESRWEPLDVAPPAQPVDPDAIEFRVPGPRAARIMWTWECDLLTESSIHLKLPYEISPVPQLAKRLKMAVNAPRQFSLAAFVERGKEEVVVGHVHAAPNAGSRNKDLTFRLNVSRDHWGSGIGRKLVEELESWARRVNARRLSTTALGHNSRGLRFADRCGFTREAVSKDYALVDGQLSDCVSLGKVLA